MRELNHAKATLTKKLIFWGILFLFSQAHAGIELPWKFLPYDKVLSQNGNAQKNSLPRNAKVLVWNVYKGRKENFVNKFLDHSDQVDLLLLQEFTEDLQQEKVEHLSEQYQFTYASTFEYKDVKKGGVATASPSRAISKRFQLSSGHFGIIPPKAALITKYNISGTRRSLLVINIHAKNLAFQKEYQKHINDIFHIIIHHRGPVLFAGDFNSWSQDRYDFIKRKLKMAHLKEVIIPEQQDKRLKAPVLSKLFDNFDYPLDNIFYKGFELRNIQSHNSHDGSDHGALSFSMVFKNYLIDNLEDLRPAGTHDPEIIYEVTRSWFEKAAETYDLSTLKQLPMIPRIKKEAPPILLGMNYRFENTMSYFEVTRLALSFLRRGYGDIKFAECFLTLEIERESLLKQIYKELLLRKVVTASQFLKIMDEYSDPKTRCNADYL